MQGFWRDGNYVLVSTIEAEAEGLKKQNARLRAELDMCAASLPGPYYMDPPDGGDVPVSEQLRRMAQDAARYRWLRGDEGPTSVRWPRWNIQHWTGVWEPVQGEEMDAAVDAAMKTPNV